MAIGSNIAPSIANISNNTFVGADVASQATSFPSWNTGVGQGALQKVASSYNVGVGWTALAGLTTGAENTGIGIRAGFDIGNPAGCVTTGTFNTFIGSNARGTFSDITNATALGSKAIVDASNCIQLGNPSVTLVKTAGTLVAAGLESIGTTLTIAGQNNTNTVDIGKGTGVQTINVGNNGTGATTINLGGGTDVVRVNLPLKDSAGANISTCRELQLLHWEKYSEHSWC